MSKWNIYKHYLLIECDVINNQTFNNYTAFHHTSQICHCQKGCTICRLNPSLKESFSHLMEIIMHNIGFHKTLMSWPFFNQHTKLYIMHIHNNTTFI